MPSRSARILPFLLLSLIVIVNAMGLLPELTISRVDLNDNAFHFALVKRIVDRVESGTNPIDCWSPEWAFGFPVLRDYQPLAHLLVATVYFALWKTVSLMTVFVWIRFLSIALLPVTFFVASRWFGLSRWTAVAAAMLAPLIATDSLYGVEYGSYLWGGTGLFPQAVAVHLMLLGVSLGRRAMREGERLLPAGILVGLTIACHIVYGYVAALSLLVAALVPDGVPAATRVRRLLGMGGIAFAASAYQVIPLLLDSPVVNHSRWEPVWKWDSVGAATALAQLFRGEFLDHGRLPVLTALAAAGAALVWWNRRRGRVDSTGVYLGATAALWILMYFGRPFWGSILTVVGVLGDMHLHRVIGAAQVFLVLLGAVGLAEAWRAAARRHVAAAVAMTAALLFPAIRERAQFLSNNAEWGKHNLEAHDAEGSQLEAAIASAKSRPGRVYAGLAAGWGGGFKVGYVPVYATLARDQVPAVGFLYHSMGLPGDLMVQFDDSRPDQYRVFGIGSVVAPVGGPGPATTLPVAGRFGRFQVLEAPGGGYFDVVDAPFAVTVNKRNFFEVNDRWLRSDWPAKRFHLLLDDGRGAPPTAKRLDMNAALPMVPDWALAGVAVSERQTGERYIADVDVRRAAYVLFKMTWHPAWKARVDGVPQPVVTLAPGFSAVAVDAGKHQVEFEYRPGALKPALLAAGVLALLLAGWWDRLRPNRAVALVASWGRRTMEQAFRHRERLAHAGITLAIGLPVWLPLLNSSLILGHDSYCYFPRLVEIHRNVTSGILLPRWAPDLGAGHGQPLFIFHPPLFYWIGEIWQLLGFGAVTATNLAAATTVIAAGFACFHLGRLHFGKWGGHITAAAYLYAPYFAVDLYVRSALEEFTAFALFPLALYGFGAFARHGRARERAIGAAAYGALLYCHFPAALLFSPLLAAYCVATAWQERSWRVLGAQAAGVALGLALGAASWFPALAEKQYVGMDRVLQGNGQYSTHFVFPEQLWSTFWGYGQSVLGREDGMSFSLGWGHIVLAALAWVWLARRPKSPGREVAFFFGVAASVFCVLMLEDSSWVWDHLPLLPYVELPWRMLGPAALCVAMLAGSLGPWIAGLDRRRGLALAAIFGLLIIPNGTHFRAGRTTEIDMGLYSPHELAVSGFETTTMQELTPRWMANLPPYDPAVAVVSGGAAEVQDGARTPFSWSGEVKARTEARVRLSFAWFPGWTVRVDGREVGAGPTPGTGLIEFATPPGDHQVEAWFGRSPARRTGEIVSVVGLVAMGAVLWLRRRLGQPADSSAKTAHA